jgi:threonine dehydratase
MNSTKDAALDFQAATERIKGTVKHTPLEYNAALSAKYNAEIYLKREDLQVVRSYKLRGAFNMMSTLTAEERAHGVVCASAGNHAQGVAYSCKKLNVKGIIFMPEITPKQKVKQTEMFGAGHIQIILVGDTFDDCMKEALKFTAEHEMTFIPLR